MEEVFEDVIGTYRAFICETEQEFDFIEWWNELEEDDRIMLHSLAIYMALGGKLNAFNVQETGVDINGV